MPNDPPLNRRSDAVNLLRGSRVRLESLYATSMASRWQLSFEQFLAALEPGVVKRFADHPARPSDVEDYLQTLHLDDLVLAAACMGGSDRAWEHFVGTYRGYLRAAAGAISKSGRSGTDAQELADSLFAELFGLIDGQRGQASLFRYFHGRSSLKTWLRTVLAQRYIDRIRRSRRWESLEGEDGERESVRAAQSAPVAPRDPHRDGYLHRFVLALHDGLAGLAPEDRQRLELYYAREKTLAEIGRLLGEHESSASRHLESARRELRAKVEQCLRTGCHGNAASPPMPPLSEPEIALCFQYAAEDSPVDFRELFPEKPVAKTKAGREELP